MILVCSNYATFVSDRNGPNGNIEIIYHFSYLFKMRFDLSKVI